MSWHTCDGTNADVDGLRPVMLDKVLLVAVKAFCIAVLIHAAVLFDGLHIFFIIIIICIVIKYIYVWIEVKKISPFPNIKMSLTTLTTLTIVPKIS